MLDVVGTVWLPDRCRVAQLLTSKMVHRWSSGDQRLQHTATSARSLILATPIIVGRISTLWESYEFTVGTG